MRARNNLEIFIGDIWSFEKKDSDLGNGTVIKTVFITSVVGRENHLFFESLDIKENAKLDVYFDDLPEVYTLICRGE